MTVIEPNKNKFTINWLIISLIIFILTGALFSVFAYNNNVRLKHLLNSHREEAESLRSANTDFKNQLYGILDLKNAEELAADLGLIKEKKPEYLARQ